MSLVGYLKLHPARLSMDDLLPILADIADALADIHGEVVHRDLKPPNILLLNGSWCLADFGIARYADAATATHTHKDRFTVPFAAPEQWLMEHATAATDVYSWLDALSSAGAMLGLIGVAVGWPWADAVAGLLVTGFICHVGWEVSSDIGHRLLDGVDPVIVTTAEATAAQTDGVLHAHARARWTGRTLRVEVEGWVEPTTTVADAEHLGRLVADRLGAELPQMRSFTWTARAV